MLLNQTIIHPNLKKDQLLLNEATRQLNDMVMQKYTAAFNQAKIMHFKGHVSEKLALLEQSSNPTTIYDSISFINTYLISLLFADEDILDVLVIPTNSNQVFSHSVNHSRKIQASYPYNSLPIIQELQASSKKIFVGYSDIQPYASVSFPVVTFAIKIENMTNLNQSNQGTVGYLLINYPADVFYNAYYNLGSLSGGTVYVTNSADTVILTTDQSWINQAYNSNLEDNAVVSVYNVGTSGLRTIGIIPQEHLNVATFRMVSTVLLILVPSMIIMLVVILVFNRWYQTRIDYIGKAMHDYNTGGTFEPMPIYHNDELGRLAKQLNEMCQRLDTQIKLKYKAEIGRKTAELNALQAQINPHFLFNTIESIRMQAVNNRDFDVSEMLLQLGQLFRWMIQLDKRIVYVEDEIEYNKSYLNLQRLRYSDSFESELIVDDEALYLGIPKFTLQPVIENALLHGLDENGIVGKITVIIRLEDSVMHIQVNDNGSGIEPEVLQDLQRHISGDAEFPCFGIGLRNVHSRIQMLFGSEYGISISSKVGAGTTVHITIPAIEKKKMEKLVEKEE